MTKQTQADSQIHEDQLLNFLVNALTEAFGVSLAENADLDTSEEGLGRAEARNRLEREGPNEIETEGRIFPFRIFIDQYKPALIWILIVAAAVMVFVGNTIESELESSSGRDKIDETSDS